jgi:hypothetical protein
MILSPAKAGVQGQAGLRYLAGPPRPRGNSLLIIIRNYGSAYAFTAAFDRAAKLLRSFCSLGGITAMQ